MKKQKKRQKGITLIALVISVIVMLILAGVSLNAMVGENGILTQAQQAKLASELAQEQEELEYMLANYNIDADRIGTVDEFLQGKVSEGELQKFTMIPDPNDTSRRVRMIQKGENFYYILEDGDYYKLEKMNTDVSGGIGEGYTIVTANNFVGGTMDFNPGSGKSATLIFNDKINADYNFNILSGEVTVYIDNDMTLTNEGVLDVNGDGRSAINIYPNASHADEIMRMARPFVRSMEQMILTFETSDTEYLKRFWRCISETTDCSLFTIAFPKEERNITEYMEKLHNVFVFLSDLFISAEPLDDKMNDRSWVLKF